MSGVKPKRAARTSGPTWVSSQPRAQRARQIADELRSQVIGGTFGDSPLPDESILADQHHASRNAVRDALGLLRDEGLITRRRGVGTMVVKPKYGHGLDQLAGLAETLSGYGAVTNDVLAARLVDDLPLEVASRLGVPAETGAVYIRRLRRVEGEPLSLDTTYLHPDIGKGLLGLDLVGRDLFDLIEEVTGQLLGSAEVSVSAVSASPETASLLAVRPGAAIFAIDRLTRFADGRPVDSEVIYMRADRMTLHATVRRGSAFTGS